LRWKTKSCKNYKSIKYRASLFEKHISGVERIVKEVDEETLFEILKRAKKWDFINLKVESVKKVHILRKSLCVRSYEFESVLGAKKFAKELLCSLGIKEGIVDYAIKLLEKGNMRGAVLLDIKTGRRLEEDKKRGVRTVLMDWQNRKNVEKIMPTLRSVDALVLATKNIYCGVFAELCWSDDPKYTTGYVASKELGYVRIKPLKEMGDPFGGRIYFIRKERLEEILDCLKRKAILVKDLCYPPRS